MGVQEKHLDDFEKNLRAQIKLHDDICTINDLTIVWLMISKH